MDTGALGLRTPGRKWGRSREDKRATGRGRSRQSPLPQRQQRSASAPHSLSGAAASARDASRAPPPAAAHAGRPESPLPLANGREGGHFRRFDCLYGRGGAT